LDHFGSFFRLTGLINSFDLLFAQNSPTLGDEGHLNNKKEFIDVFQNSKVLKIALNDNIGMIL